MEVTDRISDFPTARWIQVAVALAGDGKAQFDDLYLTAHPRDESTRRLRFVARTGTESDWPIDRRVGGKVHGQGWRRRPAKRMNLDIRESNAWILGGRFIQGKAVVTAPSGATEYLSLTTYDSREKVYRNWNFDSPGNFPETEIAGTWDEAAQTLTWKAVGKDRATHTKTIRFIDKEHLRTDHCEQGSGRQNPS